MGQPAVGLVAGQSFGDCTGRLGILRSAAAAERLDIPGSVVAHVEGYLLLCFHRALVWSAVGCLLYADGFTLSRAGNQAGSEDNVDRCHRIGCLSLEVMIPAPQDAGEAGHRPRGGSVAKSTPGAPRCDASPQAVELASKR